MKQLITFILIFTYTTIYSQIKISQLNEATSINTTDLFLISQGAASKKFQYTTLKYNLFNTIPYPLRLSFLSDTTRITHSVDSTKIETNNSYFVFNKKIKAPLFLQGNTDTLATKSEVRSLISSIPATIDTSKLVTKYDLNQGNSLGSYLDFYSSGASDVDIQFQSNDSILQFSVASEDRNSYYYLKPSGLESGANYAARNASNPRWTPDKNYVDSLLNTKINYNDTINGSGSGDIVTKHYVDSVSGGFFATYDSVTIGTEGENYVINLTLPPNTLKNNGDMIIASCSFSSTSAIEVNIFVSIFNISEDIIFNENLGTAFHDLKVELMRLDSATVKIKAVFTKNGTASIVKYFRISDSSYDLNSDTVNYYIYMRQFDTGSLTANFSYVEFKKVSN